MLKSGEIDNGMSETLAKLLKVRKKNKKKSIFPKLKAELNVYHSTKVYKISNAFPNLLIDDDDNVNEEMIFTGGIELSTLLQILICEIHGPNFLIKILEHLAGVIGRGFLMELGNT